MGNSANQTRDEIVRLREEMTGKVVALRKATARPIRIAKTVAIGTAALVVVGGVAIVVIGARHRAERKNLKRRMAEAGAAATNPTATAKRAARGLGRSLEESREKIRAELREELKKELKEEHPIKERLLKQALRSAATAAVPIVMKQLEQRINANPTGKNGKGAGSSTGTTPATAGPKP